MKLGSYRLLSSLNGICCRRAFSCSLVAPNPHAPTFSTKMDTKKLIVKLNLARLIDVIVRESPNATLNKLHNAEEFMSGSVEAVGLVTKAASEGDWDSLDGLVEPQCIDGLKEQLEGMGEVEKAYVALDPMDVFLSFISNPENCDGGTDFNVVTFSLPSLQKIIQLQNSVSRKEDDLTRLALQGTTEEYMKTMHERKKKGDFIKHDKTAQVPHEMFDKNEILVGNYRFNKLPNSEEWTISEIGQVNMKTNFNPFFRFRWRGRLGIYLNKGTSFLKVLRIDYITDIIIVVVTVGVILIVMAALKEVERSQRQVLEEILQEQANKTNQPK